MIRLVTANDPRFKTIRFADGLNVVLAQKTAASSDQQTRNGSGKSSLLRVMHFLLGANLAAPLSHGEFDGWVFAMGIEIEGKDTIVARAPGQSTKTALLDLTDGYRISTLKGWKETLGKSWFGLGDYAEKFKPTLRSLITYLVREANDGGMASPFTNNARQATWDSQVAVSFLLGLDWRISSQLELVREQGRLVENLGKAAQSGDLGSAIGTAAELRTKLAVARDEAHSTRSRLEQFKILESYRELQSEADQLTHELRRLSGADATDRDLLSDLQVAMTEEAPPGSADLERLWRTVNVVLPDAVVRSYEDARRFHESVISNRVNYLSREADAARTRVEMRDGQRSQLGERRREILATLESGGALEQFSGIQAELGRQQGLVTVLEERLSVAENIETGKVRVEQKRQEILLRLQEDFHDREASLGAAIALFERYSRRLYDDRRGSLIVDSSKNGPRFRVEILGSGSVGIDRMQILCFDLTILTLLSIARSGPGILVHDSHIFDGVDERQVANALSLAAELAEEYGFQYIVTMNEDDVPREFPHGFDFWKHVNPVRLTDATEDGGLFGFRLSS